MSKVWTWVPNWEFRADQLDFDYQWRSIVLFLRRQNSRLPSCLEKIRGIPVRNISDFQLIWNTTFGISASFSAQERDKVQQTKNLEAIMLRDGWEKYGGGKDRRDEDWGERKEREREREMEDSMLLVHLSPLLHPLQSWALLCAELRGEPRQSHQEDKAVSTQRVWPGRANASF